MSKSLKSTQHAAGVPTSVTPDFKGQLYINETTGDIYRAFGTSSGNWYLVTDANILPVKATDAVYGLARLSVAAADASEPIAVGTNDGRVPTQDENDALAGTSGTPSTSNKFVTADGLSSTVASYGNIKASLNAGETISGATLPVPVYQKATDNELYKCDATDSTKIEFLGFTISDGTDGNAITLQTCGVVGGFTGLTEGVRYYVQDTAGTIGTSKGTYAILVGIAISETQLLIMKEDRVDERWNQQTIFGVATDFNAIGYDFCFDEKQENLYLAYCYYESVNVIYIYRFKKDKKTGKFVYEGNVEVAGRTDGYCGVTVYSDKVYVSSYYGSAQHIDRYDLDLTNQATISISSGSSSEKGVMTNIGSTFYILNVSTGETLGTYTLSGTTLTRTGGVSVAGITNSACLSNDGTYFYIRTSGSGFGTPYQSIWSAQIEKVAISGGTFSAISRFPTGSWVAGLVAYNGIEAVAIYHSMVKENSAVENPHYFKNWVIDKVSL